MKKYYLVFLLFLLFTSFLFTEEKKYILALSEMLYKNETIKSEATENIGTFIVQYLKTNDRIDLLSLDQFKKILSGLNITKYDAINKETAAKIRTISAIDYIVLLSLQENRKNLYFNFTLINVRNGESTSLASVLLENDGKDTDELKRTLFEYVDFLLKRIFSVSSFSNLLDNSGYYNKNSFINNSIILHNVYLSFSGAFITPVLIDLQSMLKPTASSSVHGEFSFTEMSTFTFPLTAEIFFAYYPPSHTPATIKIGAGGGMAWGIHFPFPLSIFLGAKLGGIAMIPVPAPLEGQKFFPAPCLSIGIEARYMIFKQVGISLVTSLSGIFYTNINVEYQIGGALGIKLK